MTSIIAPWVAAAQLAAKANTSLNTASNMLRSDVPRPFTPEGPSGHETPPIAPDQSGGFIPPFVGNDAALRLSGSALQDIETALDISNSLSAGVRTAFTGARDAARAGVTLLIDPLHTPTDRSAAPQKFDAASMWLGLATNLLRIEHGMADVIPDNPFQAPGRPMPIQLPSPDSPVQ